MKTIAPCLKFIMCPPKNAKRDKVLKLIFVLVLLLLIHPPVRAQSSPPADDASVFREGEILFSKGDTEKALWRFKSVVTQFPKSPLINEAKFRMGICYTQLKRPKDAIRILSELLPTFLTPDRMVQVFMLLGDNGLELKDRLNALQWYGKGILVQGSSHDELKKKVKSVIDASDSEEELKSIESLYRGAYAGGYAKLKLVQLAKRQKNDVLAKRLLSEFEKEYPEMDYLSQAKELLETVPRTGKSKFTVGVILPLSGPQRLFGEKVLQGIQFAIREADSPLVSLAVRDTKGSPSAAENAVEELVNQEKVIAIIGPLSRVEAEGAAQKAQQLKVPLLTLSQLELPPNKWDFVFQTSLSPTDQIRTLVDYSIKNLGLQTFAVFYPNSPNSSYGLYFKNLFSQEVTRKGGKLIGAVAYQENQTNFGQEIKEFFKVKTVRKSDSKKDKEDEFNAGVSVGGLFIPDAHDRAGIILSYMAYYDITGVTFLGTNTWNGTGLISTGGREAEGAIFVDAFFNKSSSPLVAHFVEEFQKTYQRKPETLEALSYDGAQFLKELLQSKSISSPQQLREEIRRVQNFQGVTGLRGFAEDGKAIRILTILKVHQGQIEQVSP